MVSDALEHSGADGVTTSDLLRAMYRRMLTLRPTQE